MCIYECGVIYMVLIGCEWCECIGVVGGGGGGNTLPMGRGWLLLTMLGWCGRVLSIYECG